MKSLLLLSLFALATTAHADEEEITIRFKSIRNLTENKSLAEKSLASTFYDGTRYCSITVSTPPNSQRIIEAGRKVILKARRSTGSYELLDPDGRKFVGALYCNVDTNDEILKILKNTLDAEPVEPFRKIPIHYETEEHQDRSGETVAI